jgi:hypothetical protein
MTIMVTIGCDAAGCEAYEEVSAGMDDGVNTIQTALEDGWEHDGGEDWCPEHAGAEE